MLSNAPTRHCGWLGFGRRYFGCYGFGCYSFGCHEFGRSTFGCCVFGRRGFGCCGFGCRERFLYWRFWMFFGCYELWMLCFWMLRTLDSTALDASIRSPYNFGGRSGEGASRQMLNAAKCYHIFACGLCSFTCWMWGWMWGSQIKE